jgi:hypothetical protein
MAADLQAREYSGGSAEVRCSCDSSSVFAAGPGDPTSQDIKDNAKRLHHFNLAALAIREEDYNAAKTPLGRIPHQCRGVKSTQLKQAHELAGRIAGAETIRRRDRGTEQSTS